MRRELLVMCMILVTFSLPVVYAEKCGKNVGERCEGYNAAYCLASYIWHCAEGNFQLLDGSGGTAGTGTDCASPNLCWCGDLSSPLEQHCPNGQTGGEICVARQGCMPDPENDNNIDIDPDIGGTCRYVSPVDRLVTSGEVPTSTTTCYSGTSGLYAVYSSYYTCGKPSTNTVNWLQGNPGADATLKIFCDGTQNFRSGTGGYICEGQGVASSGNQYPTCTNNLECKTLWLRPYIHAPLPCEPLMEPFTYAFASSISGWTPLASQYYEHPNLLIILWDFYTYYDTYPHFASDFSYTERTLDFTCPSSGGTTLRFPMAEWSMPQQSGVYWINCQPIIPPTTPGCQLWSPDAFDVGTYCACRNCEYCTGYTYAGSNQDDVRDIHLSKVIFETDSPGTAYISNTGGATCLSAFTEELKNYCFYGENCGSTYYSPSYSDVVKVSGSFRKTCTCDASQSGDLRDCGYNGANAGGICSNQTIGALFEGVSCGSGGWTYTSYVDAEIDNVAIYNSYGDYYKYNCASPHDSREVSCSSAPGSSNVGFDKNDYISLEIVVQNIGSTGSIINKPFILVTTSDFDPDLDNTVTEYTNLIDDEPLFDSTYDVRKTGGSYELISHYPHHESEQKLSIVSIPSESEITGLFNDKAIAFWFSNDDGTRPGVFSTTSNMEKVFESGTWDNKLDPLETMTFVFTVKASEWDADMKIWFWDIDTSLTVYPTSNTPGQAMDHLTMADLDGKFDTQLKINNATIQNVRINYVKLDTVPGGYDLCVGGTCDEDAKTCDYPSVSAECPFGCIYDGHRCVGFLGGSCGSPSCPAGYRYVSPLFICDKIPEPISCDAGYYFDSDGLGNCRCVPIGAQVVDNSKLMVSGNLNLRVTSDNENFAPASPDCTDCLYCFASRLDSDSFDIFWVKQESPTVLSETTKNIMQRLYPSLSVLNHWAGMYFMPRAYSIILDGDIGLLKGQTKLELDTSSDFEWVMYENPTYTDEFAYSYYLQSKLSCQDDEDIGTDLYSLSFMNSEPMLTLKALYLNNTPPKMQDMQITIGADTYTLDIRGVASLPSLSSQATPFTLTLVNQTGDPMENFIISLVNGTDAFPKVEGTRIVGEWDMINISKAVTDSSGQTQLYYLSGPTLSDPWLIVSSIPRFTPAKSMRVDLIVGDNPPVSIPTNDKGMVTFDVSGYDNLLNSRAIIFSADNEFLAAVELYDRFRYSFDEAHLGPASQYRYVEVYINGSAYEDGIVTLYNYTADMSGIVRKWSFNHDEGGLYESVDSIPINMHTAYVLEINKSSSEQLFLYSVDVVPDDGDPATYDGIVETDIWNIETDQISGFPYKKSCTPTATVRYPVEETISFQAESGCSKMRIYDENFHEIPYQIIEERYGECDVALVADPGQELNLYYGSLLSPEPRYDLSWVNIGENDVGNIEFSGDAIDFEYSKDCESDTGPCIISFENWVSEGLMWDVMESQAMYVDMLAVDGPVKKCVDFSYYVTVEPETVEFSLSEEILEGLTYEELIALEDETVEVTASERTHLVERRACVYKSIPAVFETFTFLGDEISHDLRHSVLPSSLGIYTLSGVLQTPSVYTFSPPTGPGSASGSYATWNNSMLLLTNLGDTVMDYYIDTSDNLVQDPYISDLYMFFKDNMTSMPDSIDFANTTSNIMNLDYETLELRSVMGYEWDNGSMDYYARMWTTSGTTLNCDDETITDFDMIKGSTCETGSQDKATMSLGIQRTGAHFIKFVTPEEDGVDAGLVPNITLLNSMGERPRVIEPTQCEISGEAFNCIIEKDDKDLPIDISKQGYVLNCLVYEDDYQDIETRYFNPYIFPMKWEIDFNLVVNPYITAPVPILIEEKQNQLTASTCGDWICQEGVEYCYNCPPDCPDVGGEFLPTVK